MNATQLPHSCGDVMEIPGTPSIGCVAVLQYNMGTAAGFSCCVVASQEEVYILGPNLKTQDGSLLSVRLWRPHAEENVARMISLVAFLWHPQDDSKSNVFGRRGVTPVGDEVCVVVAWEDGCEQQKQQHITTLRFSLRNVLCATDTIHVVVSETSFFQDRGQQRVLRLFYHQLFSDETTKGNHIVLCSCYNESVQKNVLLSLSEDFSARILTKDESRESFLVNFSFVVCSALSDEMCAWKVEWGLEPPAYVARWLLEMSSTYDGVACAIAVQPGSSVVIAALGTTKGVLVLFCRDGACTTHSIGGPIADLAFVDTRRIRGNKQYSNSYVTQLVKLQQTKKDHNLSAVPGVSDETENPLISLVVLDSFGRVIVFCDVGLETQCIRTVSDVHRFITIAAHCTLCAGNTSGSGAVEELPAGKLPANIGSKNFFDFTSPYLLFQGRKQKRTETELPDNKMYQSFLSDPDALRELMCSDSKLVGHLMSRGILALAVVPGPSGYVELVVSTMAQFIVSIPYDAEKGFFFIAGFIEAPESMYFIDFVDFFNTGVPEFVMAGKQHVLVSKLSLRQQKHRSALLFRLLAAKKIQSAAPSESVKTA